MAGLDHNHREHDRLDHETYVETILTLVEQIPVGQVSTYGDLAEMIGRGGPRGIGKVMSLHGGAVPWWRVIRASGHPPALKESYALDLLRAEGVPLRRGRVDLAAARWAGPTNPVELCPVDTVEPHLCRSADATRVDRVSQCALGVQG